MKHTANIVFMGTPNIAVSMLKQIVNDGYRVIGVVTQPDKKVGRKQLLQMPEVKEFALQHNIPVYQPMHIREDYEELMQLPIDLIVTCAYGQFIPQVLLDFPTYGSINVHASLLPKLRGGAPIHKAIINGDQETGISIMRMVKKMDAGDVMAQCHVGISIEDTMGTLYDKLAVAGANLLSKSIPQLLEGHAVFEKQEEAAASFAYTIRKEEEYINFHAPVLTVYNHIRGLIPSPVGYSIIQHKKLKFHRVRMLVETHTYQSGEVVGMVQGGYAIAAIGGYILLDELQMEGKSKVDALSFYHGSGKNLIGMIVE